MRRSLQEYVELVVFGLVALLVGTGLLWLVGWVLSIGGVALKWIAGLLWNLLRFIVPVAIAGGLVYFLVKAAQDRQPKPATAGAGGDAPLSHADTPTAPASPATSTPGTTRAQTVDAGASDTVAGSADAVAGTVVAEDPAVGRTADESLVTDDASAVPDADADDAADLARPDEDEDENKA